ncbi:MAG: hypothetical protein EON54_25205 [Alcaligenaceae bacterium]|nr:MAG: hypothetical protein EON54_25205 [Alcaligenaceae bacterium]
MGSWTARADAIDIAVVEQFYPDDVGKVAASESQSSIASSGLAEKLDRKWSQAEDRGPSVGGGLNE